MVTAIRQTPGPGWTPPPAWRFPVGVESAGKPRQVSQPALVGYFLPNLAFCRRRSVDGSSAPNTTTRNHFGGADVARTNAQQNHFEVQSERSERTLRERTKKVGNRNIKPFDRLVEGLCEKKRRTTYGY